MKSSLRVVEVGRRRGWPEDGTSFLACSRLPRSCLQLGYLEDRLARTWRKRL